MWRAALAFAGLWWVTAARSQDVIVNLAGDTLHCKITTIRDDRIYYSQDHEGHKVNLSIRKEEVTYYHREGYFPVTLGPADGRPSSGTTKAAVPDPMRIGFNAGWTWRTAPISDDLPAEWKDYYKGLLWGTHYGGDLSYAFSRTFGGALLLDIGRWHNSSDGMPFVDTAGATVHLSVKDRITMGTFGPGVYWRSLTEDGKFLTYMHLGGAYTWYRDEFSLHALTVVLHGWDLCLIWDAGFDAKLGDHVALGLGVGIVRGTLSKVEADIGTTTLPVNLPLGTEEALHRVNFTGGFRFLF